MGSSWSVSREIQEDTRPGARRIGAAFLLHPAGKKLHRAPAGGCEILPGARGAAYACRFKGLISPNHMVSLLTPAPPVVQESSIPLLPGTKAAASRRPVPGTRWADDSWRDAVRDGWELTEREWMRLQDQDRRRRWCGATWARMSARSQDGTERLQELSCGQRGCPGCGLEARTRARRRLATSDIYHGGIEWRAFVTGTIPRNARVCKEDAWRDAGARMSAWCKRVQKVYEKLEVPENERHIGWALEAHQDGWPHAHIVLSRVYPESEHLEKRWMRWMRRIWNRVWGVEWSVFQLEKPKKPHRAGDYLAKYVGKMEGWGDELMAILYRKRLWSSTLPLVPTMIPPPPRWHLEMTISCFRAIARYQRAIARGEVLTVDRAGAVISARENWPSGWDAPGCDTCHKSQSVTEITPVDPVESDRWTIDRHREKALEGVPWRDRVEMGRPDLQTWRKSETEARMSSLS